MKIYVHFEIDIPCTLIVHLDSRATISDLKQLVLKRYESKYGKQLSPGEVSIRTKYKNTCDNDLKVESFFGELDDAFLVLKTAAMSTKKSKGQSKTQNKLSPEKLQYLIIKAENEAANRHLKIASESYLKILESCPTHKETLLLYMKLWLDIGRPEVALKWSDTSLQHFPSDLEILIAVGKLKHACKDYETSIQIFNKALELMKKKVSVEFEVKEWSLGVKDCGAYTVKDVEILVANAMYALGGVWEGPAVQLVMSVVEPERTHFEGLLLYAKVAFDRGLCQDAVRVLLRLIVQQKENEEVKELLADCLEKESALNFIFEELKTGEGLGSACVFLGARIKDYSAISAARKLYQKALELDPTNSSIVLNYLHILELVSEMNQALKVAKTFLMECTTPLIRSCECKDIAVLLDEMDSLSSRDNIGWLRKEGWTPKPRQEEVEEIVEKVQFNEDQLDLLASLFTIVKILFITGALERAYKAVELIKLCCKATKVELHKTLIRNEAAYFNCIDQILKQYPPPLIPPSSTYDLLYICGDSHCLSGAWQKLQVHGKERLLVPKLVTGCKVWHLRKESRFYPKTGFQQTMKSIPDGSSIIFLFGEIDCREGISLAVEKCKYESQAEAIETTISIYLEVIQDLMKKRNFTVYVHPVPPVLDLTRRIVKSYNSVLKKMVVAAKEENGLMTEKLFWLDFFPNLLTASGERLNPELQFDDTHLSPKYTQYLQAALEKC